MSGTEYHYLYHSKPLLTNGCSDISKVLTVTGVLVFRPERCLIVLPLVIRSGVGDRFFDGDPGLELGADCGKSIGADSGSNLTLATLKAISKISKYLIEMHSEIKLFVESIFIILTIQTNILTMPKYILKYDL